MAIEFPNWIRPVTNRSYGYQITGQNLQYTPVAGGISRVAMNYVQEKVPFNVVFVINNGVEMQGWVDWYFHVSNQGTTKFAMPLDSGNGVEDHVCIIVPNTYNVTGDFPWTITLTIEAERVTAPFDGNLFEMMQAGYTSIPELLDRLTVFANEDVL